MTFLLLTLLSGLVSHVNAGVSCKSACMSLTPKDGSPINVLTMLNPFMSDDCTTLDVIECADGESCYYTERSLSADIASTGETERGVLVDIGCHAIPENVLTCDIYALLYPQPTPDNSATMNLDDCVLYTDDAIPKSSLGLPEEEETPDEDPKEDDMQVDSDGDGDVDGDSDGDGDDDEGNTDVEPDDEVEDLSAPIKCHACVDVVKVDDDGVEEVVVVEGAASCSDASVVECPGEVESCASATLTYNDNEGIMFRKSLKACMETALDCDSLKAELEGFTVTDCDVANTAAYVEPDTEDEGTDVEDNQTEDETYDVDNSVEEGAVKGSSMTPLYSSFLLIISLTMLW